MSFKTITRGKNSLEIRNEGATAELLLIGAVGGSWFDDSGILESEVRDALKEIPNGKPIAARINSEGGSVQEGLGIYNAFKERSADITAHIEGFALSIASIIPLAASKVVSPKSAIWMMHKAWSYAAGNSDDMDKASKMLSTNDEMLAEIYASATGKPIQEMRDAMTAETWIRGSAAVDFGLADETDSEPDAKASAYRPLPENYLNRCRNVAPAILNTLRITQNPPVAVAPEAPAKTTPSKIMEPKTEPAAAQSPAIDTSALEAKILALETKTAEQEIAITAMKAQPLAGRASVIGDAHDRMIEAKEGVEKRLIIVNQWSDIRKSAAAKIERENSNMEKDARRIFAANTVSANITTQLLSQTVYTILQNRLAMLKGFFLDVQTDPVKPLATIQVPKITAGATAQTDPTDWESGNSTVSATAVTMHEYSVSFNASNADIQSGMRMGWLTYINAITMANKIVDVVLAPVTVANFGAATVTSAAAAFGFSDLQNLWAAAKDFDIRNLVLDGSYWARLIPANTFGFALNNGAPNYAFDGIWYHNRWSAAGANIVGAVFSPQSIAIAPGLPLEPAGMGYQFSSLATTLMPEIGFSVQSASWFKPGTRVQWSAFDLMLGVSAADGSAAKLIASA